MEEISLTSKEMALKFATLINIIFTSSGNINEPHHGIGIGRRNITFTITYDNYYFVCYIKTARFGPGSDNGTIGHTPYKKFKITFLPDIKYITYELSKYSNLMNLYDVKKPHSDPYGIDLIINILKLINEKDKIVNDELQTRFMSTQFISKLKDNEKDKKDKEIDELKKQIRIYVSQIDGLKLEIKDKYKEIERLKRLNSSLSEEDEIRDADIKAKLYALKDKEAKERLQMFYEENISIQMSEFVKEQLNDNQ